jgi:ABC-2 type transport system permease protein
MRLYLEVARHSYRRFATYRAATAAGVFANTVWGFIKACIFMALWTARGEIGGYDVVDAVTFAFLSQALSAPLSMFGLSTDLPERIKSGAVTVELQRPADFQGWWLATDLGRATHQIIWRAPPFLVGALAFTVHVPQKPWIWCAFLISVYLGVTVSFGLRYLVSLSVWWLMDARGLNAVAGLLMMFLSGMVVPLVLLPGWFGELAMLLPWSAVLQVPSDVFLGKHSPVSTIMALVFQVCWALAILALGRLLTARMRTAVVVQGG